MKSPDGAHVTAKAMPARPGKCFTAFGDTAGMGAKCMWIGLSTASATYALWTIYSRYSARRVLIA